MGTESFLWWTGDSRGGEDEVRLRQADSWTWLVMSLLYGSVTINRENHFCIDMCPKSHVCLMMVAGFTQDAVEPKNVCLVMVAAESR